jgi:NAD(P)-dependent dehydrogenase (short-subunit alcohol dehydrogenase family)
VDTAIVTGAGRGIGRELARQLAGRGYAVLVTDVVADAAEATAADLGAPAWGMALDVRDPEAHRAAAWAASERGPLRVWVNNAGVARSNKAWQHPDEEVRLMVEVNLLGMLRGCRAAADAMGAAGGHVISIASMSSFGPAPGLAVYAATKAAVLSFTTSLQGDLDAAGIPVRLHAVCPDGVDTGMVREEADRPDLALVFSGPPLLDAAEVAERTVALLDGKRMVLSIPRRRGMLARSAAPFPRAALLALRFLRREGERKRRRYREAASAEPGS